jgi:hypothetical protein
MFGATQLFEVYHDASLPDEEAIVLVRQGFSIPAFVFHIGWLLYHRLWIEGAIFMALYVGIVMAGDHYGFSSASLAIGQLALQCLLGANAADIRGLILEHRGFKLVDVATGTSAWDAERRYYYAHEVRA